MEVITLTYQDDTIGAVSFDTEKGIGSFEYEPGFIKKGIELSPIKMPLSNRIYSCSGLTSYFAWPDFISMFWPTIIDSTLWGWLTLIKNGTTLINTGTDFIGLGPL